MSVSVATADSRHRANDESDPNQCLHKETRPCHGRRLACQRDWDGRGAAGNDESGRASAKKLVQAAAMTGDGARQKQQGEPGCQHMGSENQREPLVDDCQLIRQAEQASHGSQRRRSDGQRKEQIHERRSA